MIADNINNNNKSLVAKFLGIYFLSLILVGYICYYFFSSKTTAGSLQSSKPIAAAETMANTDMFSQAGMLYDKYKQLKALDGAYQQTILDSSLSGNREQLARQVTEAEAAFNIKVDSLERAASKSQVPAEKTFLTTLGESFRLAMNDRAATKIKRTGSEPSNLNNTAAQPSTDRYQSEIQARDSRIIMLESTIRSLENKSTSGPTISNGGGGGNVQELNDLRATVSAQDKKITALNISAAAMEKENTRLTALTSDQNKKTADNGMAANTLKTQNAQLQSMVDGLNADVRFAQVDCNFSRVDAAQIVSNSKQRKVLLNDALGVLRTLAASDDPAIKRKAVEKIAKLNQIASTIRD